MEKYNVSGMSCAACVARVEKAVNKVPGVTSCSVNLLTNSMGVEGTTVESEIISAVERAGYKAKKLNKEIENAESLSLKKRLIFSIIFLLPLMFLCMSHIKLPYSGYIQMILSLIVLIINKKFFVSGAKGFLHLSPNMDSLVALGSGISFLYSSYLLFIMKESHSLYFDSAAMIVTLITVGKLLEAISKGKTTNALKSLIELKPETARVIKNDKEIIISVEEIKVEDIFIVKPGESIPTDGIIIEGFSSIDESSLTGESLPADKKDGDKIFAATINKSGFIKCRATKIRNDTTIAQIIQLVSDSAATKAPIAKIADKVSAVFVPAIIILSLLTFIIWKFSGAEIAFSIQHAITVLVVSCPCALGLATPVAIMVGNGIAAKNGILIKSSQALEIVGKSKFIFLDKTGTITKGQPVVTEIDAYNISEEELIKKAVGLETKSEHPLAKAVIKKAEEEKISIPEISDFAIEAGKGLSGSFENTKVFGGNLSFLKEKCPLAINDEIIKNAEALAEKGNTPLCFAEENKFLGIIAVADSIKEESPVAINEIKKMGLYTIMLTGDNEKTAKNIAEKAGVDKVYAGLLPHEKEKIIREYKNKGLTCMVGDGINDAPALTSADTGIAIGAGTDIAIDAANIVLIKNSLSDLVPLIQLSRKTVRNIHENLFWAFFYNIALIPLAAGLYHNLFNLDMNPIFGAAAMSLSSFCVVTNALRLNFFKAKNSLQYKINSEKETKMTEEKIIKIEGMMCCNCERHVKEALEKIDGVVSAKADHEKNIASLKLSKEVSDAELKKAVSDAGYTFVE